MITHGVWMKAILPIKKTCPLQRYVLEMWVKSGTTVRKKAITQSDRWSAQTDQMQQTKSERPAVVVTALICHISFDLIKIIYFCWFAQFLDLDRYCKAWERASQTAFNKRTFSDTVGENKVNKRTNWLKPGDSFYLFLQSLVRTFFFLPHVIMTLWRLFLWGCTFSYLFVLTATHQEDCLHSFFFSCFRF